MATDITREQELERRIAELERRLAAADRTAGAFDTPQTAFWALVHRLFPEDARRHMKAATREQLMAARTYIDRWITSLEGAEAEAKQPARREQIEIE
jgi:uncharacterized coiled-coil protein SlyX